MNVNIAYELWSKDPSPATEEVLYSEILKYARRFVSRQYGGVGGHFDTVEDAITDTALKVFRHIQNFKRNSIFSTWLYRVTRGVCLDHITNRATQKGSLMHEDMEDPVGVVPVYHKSVSLRSILDSCTPQEADLIRLKMDGYGDREIAEKMGLSLSAVKLRWFRLKGRLAKEKSPK